MRVHGFLRRSALTALLVLTTAASAMAQGGRVAGTVKDEKGDGIKGATVVAENPDASPDSFTATTDDKGRFAMLGLRSGRWTLSAGAPGYPGQSGELVVRTLPAVSQPVLFTLRKIPAPPSALGPIAAKDLQADLGKADQLFNDERWDDAIASYRAILAEAPALNVINLQIASAFRNKHEFDNALAAYDALLKVDPDNDKAKVGIAMTNLEKGDLQSAEQTLEIASRVPNATREVFYNLAEVKLSKNKIDEATKAYERATQVDPTWGKPVFALGRVAMMGGNNEGATRYFERVVEIDPTSPEATQAKAALEQLKK